MRKRTLNQTWILCLRMWRWIAKTWIGDGSNIHELKARWLRENGINENDIYCNCFFCDYAEDHCLTRCPGKLVDSHFSCGREVYDYESNPVAFYKELLRLNRIRRAKK